MIRPELKIGVAFVFGLLLIAVAYNAREYRGAETPSLVAEPMGREYVPTADSDENGVPDWQDSLLDGTTINLSSSTEPYERPTSLTGRFGLTFFEDLIRSKIYGPFGDSPEELADASAKKIIESAVDELLTEEDITTFDTTDPGVLKGYANQIATILTRHPQEGDTELYILQEYLRYENPEKLAELEPIALSYTTITKELLETQVPKNYTKEHLDLVNAVNAVREDIRAMQKEDEDALYSLVRTKRYEDDVVGMGNAIKNLFNALYLRDGLRFGGDEPVSKIMVFPS